VLRRRRLSAFGVRPPLNGGNAEDSKSRIRNGSEWVDLRDPQAVLSAMRGNAAAMHAGRALRR
jgi:hypothetical protein